MYINNIIMSPFITCWCLHNSKETQMINFPDTPDSKCCRANPLIISQFCHFPLTFANFPLLCLNQPVISFGNFLVMVVWCLVALTLTPAIFNDNDSKPLRGKCWLICVFKLSVQKHWTVMHFCLSKMPAMSLQQQSNFDSFSCTCYSVSSCT